MPPLLLRVNLLGWGDGQLTIILVKSSHYTKKTSQQQNHQQQKALGFNFAKNSQPSFESKTMASRAHDSLSSERSVSIKNKSFWTDCPQTISNCRCPTRYPTYLRGYDAKDVIVIPDTIFLLNLEKGGNQFQNIMEKFVSVDIYTKLSRWSNWI